MAKSTLLDLVQDILGELNSDEVNSISDTTEATTVAGIIRRVYRDIVSEQDVPSKMDIVNLTGLSDTSRPNIMQIPENVSRILWIKYDNRVDVAADRAYADIPYKDPLDFIAYVNARPDTDTTNYQVVQWSINMPLTIYKYAGPTCWTSFDDEYVVFDSFNIDVDSSLQASKSIAQVYKQPSLTLTDTAEVDLPENLESLLWHEAFNRASIALKSEQNPKNERNENRFRVRAQRNKWRQGRMKEDYPSYGRK